VTWSTAQVGHKIQSEIKPDGGSYLVRQVANHGSFCQISVCLTKEKSLGLVARLRFEWKLTYCFREGMIEGVFCMLFYNWALRIKGQNLTEVNIGFAT
jgi:hypothetical protein